MKAQELRIGNLVNTGNNIFAVDGIKTRKIEKKNFCGKYIMGYGLKDKQCLYGRWIEHLNPVPLTEEWLVKFGLKEYSIDRSDEKYYLFSYMKTEYLIKVKPEYKESNGNCGYVGILEPNQDILFFKWNMKHVHQLQNLYFALTGEELTIKE